MTSNSATLSVAAGTAMARGVDVTTYKNDLNRSGQNLAESTLTLDKCRVIDIRSAAHFCPWTAGSTRSRCICRQLSAAGGTFNTVFVATEHDSVYAFDSDSGAILWHVSLLGTGEMPSDTSRLQSGHA